MSDIESISSDFDNDLFTEEFLESIPDDSDSNDSKCCFEDAAESSSTLQLEVGLPFLNWKHAFDYVKQPRAYF
ncbi:hypothetical protein C1645_838500 [Glomus cerebriforme]|uniref:Uncharacterized protein n=1 Tax=Glomus cerebriforme TaxID=658196 RepID=A0A397S996_9GLOM|nr:hypothetical protein C1645_838500 [Glomus cerebriforme]